MWPVLAPALLSPKGGQLELTFANRKALSISCQNGELSEEVGPSVA